MKDLKKPLNVCSHFNVLGSQIWIWFSKSPLAKNFPSDEMLRLCTTVLWPLTSWEAFLSSLLISPTFFDSVRDHLTIVQSFDALNNDWQSCDIAKQVRGCLWSLQCKCLIKASSTLSYKSATVLLNFPLCSSKSSFRRWAITDLSISASSLRWRSKNNKI